MVLLADFTNTTGDPVFDGTLRQALAIKLEESPFLKLASDAETRETMSFMGLADEELVTVEHGLEICQRQGNKAIVTAEIAPLGASYVVTVTALGCLGGDVLARHQAQASSPEGVLPALSEVSSEVRRSLGESLASVQAFDVPISQASTSSLEALKAYSVGVRMRGKGLEEDSLRHFKRAIELDPEFAMAHASLGVVFSNLGQPREYAEHMRIAYERRDRVNQAERSYISAHYHQAVTGDFEKIIETYEMWTELYPRALVPVNNLAAHYNWTGEIEKAVAPAERALELGPEQAWPHRELIQAYLQAGRLDEARRVLDDALAKGFELFELQRLGYYLAYLEGDAEGMRAVAGEQPGPPLWLLAEQANVAASAGRLARAMELLREVADGLLAAGLDEMATEVLAWAARNQAFFDDGGAAEILVAEARSIASNSALYDNALALGWAGADEEAMRIIEQMEVYGQPGTQTLEREKPIAVAAVLLSQGDPSATLESLAPVPVVERRYLIAFYLRGMAQLELGDGAAAAAEFDKIQQVPGVRPTCPLHTLTHLGLARAHALSGDLGASRVAYEEFFTLVEEADVGLPLIEAARAEYADLSDRPGRGGT